MVGVVARVFGRKFAVVFIHVVIRVVVRVCHGKCRVVNFMAGARRGNVWYEGFQQKEGWIWTTLKNLNCMPFQRQEHGA